MNTLRLDLMRTVRQNRAGFAAVGFVHAQSLIIALLDAPGSALLMLALMSQLVATLLFWSMVAEDLRSHAGPELAALLPRWRVRQRAVLVVWLTLGLLLPPLLAGLLLGPASALGLAAASWPVAALVAWKVGAPKAMRHGSLPASLVAATLVVAAMYVTLQEISIHPGLQWLLAMGGLAGLGLLARSLARGSTAALRASIAPAQPGQPTRIGVAPAQERHSSDEDAIDRFELAWARRRRPAPGRPAGSRQALGQLGWLLGPFFHRHSPLPALMNLGIVAIAVCVIALVIPIQEPSPLLAGALGLSFTMLGLQSATVLTHMQQGAAEQKLLGLLPGWVNGARVHAMLRVLLLQAIVGPLQALIPALLVAIWWLGQPALLLTVPLWFAALLALNLAIVERLLLAGRPARSWHVIGMVGLSVLALVLLLASLGNPVASVMLPALLLAGGLADLALRGRRRPLRLPLPMR